MLVISTQSGSVYLISDTGEWSIQKSGSPALSWMGTLQGRVQYYYSFDSEPGMAVADVAHLPEEKQLPPTVGKHLYIKGKDTWRLTTPIVSIETKDEMSSEITTLAEKLFYANGETSEWNELELRAQAKWLALAETVVMAGWVPGDRADTLAAGFTGATRLTVIETIGGTQYERWDIANIDPQIQDQGRTVKLFITRNGN